MSRFADRIRADVQFELDAAEQAEIRADAGAAFRHLERAHVLGQMATVDHLRVHGRMLLWALRQRNPGEAAGQLWRLLGAALFTCIGLVPTGNTGGAGVSGFRRMPIADDLQRVIDAARR